MGLGKSFIVQSIKKNQFRVTEHATMQRLERNIPIEDIKRALLNRT